MEEELYVRAIIALGVPPKFIPCPACDSTRTIAPAYLFADQRPDLVPEPVTGTELMAYCDPCRRLVYLEEPSDPVVTTAGGGGSQLPAQPVPEGRRRRG